MKKGFTLIEMSVGLAICSILMLTVGAISRASLGSYDRLTKEAEAYNDFYFGVDLIERTIRRAQGSVVPGTNALTVGMLDNNTNQTYSIIFNNNGTSLTYKDNRTPAKINVIMRNVTNLTFISSNSMALYNVFLSGTKELSGPNDTVKFNRSISVLRRNI